MAKHIYPSTELLNIFTDESRHTDAKFMLMGGILMPSENVTAINVGVDELRTEHNMTSELKWNKVSLQKLPEYLEFVDLFFKLNNNDKVNFSCLVYKNTQTSKKYTAEETFQQLYFQLLYHSFGKDYYDILTNTQFIVHHDKRDSSYNLKTTQFDLNNKFYKDFGVYTDPFISLSYLESRKSNILQLNDIILGAVGYKWNELHKVTGASKAKIDLMDYIIDKTGLGNITKATNRRTSRFCIWHFEFKK